MRLKIIDIFRNATSLYSARQWIALVIPFSLSLTFIVGIGPQIQESALSILDTGAPSIYEAAYKNGVAVFPLLDRWLLDCINPLYLSIACIVAIYSLRKAALGGVMAAVAVSLFATYSAVDAFNVATAKPFDASWLILNIASNIIGGLALAVVAALLLITYRKIGLFIEQYALGLKIMPPIGMILLSIAISSGVHFAVRFLYNPLPVAISFDTKDSLNGHYSTSGKLNILDRGQTPPSKFSWTHEDARTNRIVAEPFMDSAKITWVSSPKSDHYSIELRMYANCDGDEVRRSSRGAPYIKIDNVKRIETIVMSGPMAFLLHTEKPSQLMQERLTSGSFWITPNENGRSVNRDLDLFSLKAGIRARSKGGAVFVLRPALIRMDRKTAAPESKTFDIIIDGKSYRHRLPSVLEATDETSLKCRALTPEAPPNKQGGPSLVSSEPAMWTEVFVRIVPMGVEPLSFSEFDQTLTMSPVQGTIRAYSIGAPDGALPLSGLTRLSIRTGAGSLSVGGTASTLGNMDTLDLWGDMGVVVDKQRTFLSGTAEAAWQGGKRLNKTKWEMLPSDWQLWIIGGILAGAVALWSFARRSVAGMIREDVLQWV